MSGDVRRSVRRSSVPPLDGPSSCTSSDSQRLPTLKSPSNARLLDWRLKDHLHTVQVYFQAPFRKFSGMGSPFPCMVCRGSHWKALKNATDLLPKTAGGGGRNHHCLISRCQAWKNHGTSQPELYMAIKLFDWRFQPVCSLEIEGPELQDMAPGNKFFLQFLSIEGFSPIQIVVTQRCLSRKNSYNN